MPPETLPTVDELKSLDDLSATQLYRLEVQRLAVIERDDQPPYIEAARNGDVAAQHALLQNSLNWVRWEAWKAYQDRSPAHLDMMDLVGQANLRMVEALPHALSANDPVAYLMSIGYRELHYYISNRDALIRHPTEQRVHGERWQTVSLDSGELPLAERIAKTETQTNTPEYQIFYGALARLCKRHREVLTAAYGLYGERQLKVEDIADMLGLPKGTIEKYLWRAKRRLAQKLGPYLIEQEVQAGGGA
ncbi:MAG TPA: sigma-70 family RNA polymerase sigma factor [Ktedonobacteraceae bacterium]|nr:sigma-70 family RNA polymerase sigma factor [Ktedonobacteraceae bacterium]